MYPQSMLKSKKKKNILIFHLKINIFTAVKYNCILHGRVWVMSVRIFAIELLFKSTFCTPLKFSVNKETSP